MECIHLQKTVLIVDDEKSIVDILKFNLENADFRVLFAYDGLEGLSLARSGNPDLILLDIMLPHVDGFSVGILSHGRFRLRRFVEMGMTIFGTGIFLPIFPNSFFQVRIMRTCLDGLPNHSYRAFGDLDVVRDPSIAPRHALRLHQYDFDRFAFVFVGSTQSVRRVGTGGEDPRIRRRAEVNPALDRFVRTKRDVRLEPMKSVAENVFVGGSVVENVQRRELDTVLHRLNVRLAGLDVRPDPRLRSRIEDDLNRQDILDRRVVHGRFGK